MKILAVIIFTFMSTGLGCCAFNEIAGIKRCTVGTESVLGGTEQLS